MNKLQGADWVFNIERIELKNPCVDIAIKILKSRFQPTMFVIIETGGVDSDRLEKGWYAVTVSSMAMRWMKKTFVEGKDYFEIRSLKGVWLDVPESILIIMKLKWA